MHTGQIGLGFNPLSTIKRGVTTAARATEHGVVAAGKGVAKGTTFVVKKAVIAPAEFAAEISKAAGRLILRPVTSRVRTLSNRRANKIAWDKRKSKTPTPAERAEAKSWTKSKLKHQLPHGPLLAMLAGPIPVNFGSYTQPGELGVAPAVIAALVPVFIALMNSLLSQFNRSGEAPIAIGPDGQIIQAGDPTMVPDAAADEGPPPGSDMQAQADAAMPDGGGGGGGPMIHPSNKGLLIAGAVGLGLIVAMSLGGKSSSSKSKK